MARLIYITNTSLDDYIEDSQGKFDFSMPDEEVHSFINDLVRPAGTFLYGRRLYETMAVWETDPDLAGGSGVMREFAGIWQAADKIVYSRTLKSVSTRRTRLERSLDPGAVRQMKEALEADILIGGAELAAQALRAGLVDEVQLIVAPVILGGGKPALPDHLRVELELLEEHTFGSGEVYLRYRTKHGMAT